MSSSAGLSFRRHTLALLAGAVVAAACALGVMAQSATPVASPAPDGNSPSDLAVAEAMTRTLQGGQRHEYRVALSTNESLRAVVDQRGVDVVVKVIDPNGRTIAEVDSPNGDRGPEPVFVVASLSGSYRVTVEALEAAAPSGQYVIRVAEIRALTPLVLGTPVEATLEGGAAQAFAFDAVAGQFASLTLEQLGTDFELSLGDAGEQRRVVRDVDGELARHERLSVTVPSTGRSHVVVTSTESKGRFRLQLDALRPGTAADAATVTAEAALAEGARLRGLASSIATAVDRYEEAIQAWRQLGLQARLPSALLLKADALIALNRYPLATAAIDEALELSVAQGDRANETSSLIKSGVAVSNVGRPQEALDRFQRGLAIATAEGLPSHEMVLLNNIGQIHSEAGRSAEALPFLERAAVLAKQAGAPGTLFAATNNLAGVHDALGNFQAALDNYREALRLSREGEAIDDQAIALNNLGSVYSRLGQIDMSIDHHRQALELMREARDERGQATALTNIASLELGRGRAAEALTLYEQALALRRSSKDVAGEAGTLYNMGNLFNEPLRDFPKALDHLNQAAAILRRLDHQGNLAVVLGVTAKVYFRTGERQRAIDTYRQSLALSQAMGDRRSESVTLHLIGVALREVGDLPGARAAIEASLAIRELLRRSVSVAALRTSYFASARDTYEVYIDLLMRLHESDPAAGHDRLALEVAERARARTLLDTVLGGRVDLDETLAPSLRNQQTEAVRALNAAATRLAAAQRERRPAEDIAGADRAMNAALAGLADAEAAIRRASPDYAALALPDPMSADAIRTSIVDADSVLLEFSLGAERSVLWVVTPTNVTAVSLPKRADLEPLVRRYRELLVARTAPVPRQTAAQFRTRIEAADREADQVGRTLSRLLLAPAREAARGKRLLIVPDGALEALPFAALPSPVATGEAAVPLVVAHEIVVLPSSSTLQALRQRSASRPRSTPKAVAVLADPVFSRSDVRVAAASRSAAATERPAAGEALRAADSAGVASVDGNLPRLRFTRNEADSILSLLPAAATSRFLNFDANLATATSAALSGHRILHIATHAFANDERPELSGIVLSLVGPDGKPVEGFLRLNQIYGLDLSSAELAVLSACQTAMGREVAGEGIVGLTRGFLHAGAPSVVSSLWTVNDQSTSELMRTFYAGMLGRDALSKAAALRAAQIAMWKQPRWRAPYYWAAFELFGDWR